MYLACLLLVYPIYNARLSRAVSHNENARHVGCVKSSNDPIVHFLNDSVLLKCNVANQPRRFLASAEFALSAPF